MNADGEMSLDEAREVERLCEEIRSIARGYTSGAKNPEATAVLDPLLADIGHNMRGANSYQREKYRELRVSIEDAFGRGASARRPPGEPQDWITSAATKLIHAVQPRGGA